MKNSPTTVVQKEFLEALKSKIDKLEVLVKDAKPFAESYSEFPDDDEDEEYVNNWIDTVEEYFKNKGNK